MISEPQICWIFNSLLTQISSEAFIHGQKVALSTGAYTGLEQTAESNISEQEVWGLFLLFVCLFVLNFSSVCMHVMKKGCFYCDVSTGILTFRINR